MDINGTSSPDSLPDTSGDDVIKAGAGDDVIFVTSGHDVADGEEGRDALFVLWTNATAPVLNETPTAGYSVRLVTGAGRSVDFRNIEGVIIDGGSGNDDFTTGSGDDTITDGPAGGAATGNDMLAGGAGDDTINFTNGDDSGDGGEGTDSVSINWILATAPVTNAAAPGGFDWRFEGGPGRSVNLVGFEHISISGGSADDTITTAGGDDTIFDGPGGASPPSDNDLLDGGGGNDLILLFGGHDVADGGSGTDEVWLNWRASTAAIVMGVAPAGYDIRFESGANRSANVRNAERYIISGGSGNDVVVTSGGDDTFFDHPTAVDQDSFSGAAGSDHHYVNMGFDRSDGGAGYDTAHILWSNATTPIVMGSAAAGFEIRFQTSSNRTADFTGYEAFTVELGSGNDVIILGGTDDILLDIGGGDDVIDVGGGANIVLAGEGKDDVRGGGGVDNLSGEAGNDTLRGGGGNDFLYGGTGNDEMFGEDGDDAGWMENDGDSFDGGAGIDTAVVIGPIPSFTARVSTDTEIVKLVSGMDTQFGPGGQLFDYQVLIPDSAVAAGSFLTVQATDLLAGEDLNLDASAEQQGGVRIFTGRGVDTLVGGSGNDGFMFGSDGNLTAADRVTGGPGTDTLAMRGTYSGPTAIAFAETSIATIEVLALLSGHTNEYGGVIGINGFDYDVTMANGNVAASLRLDVIGALLASNETVRFDGRAETDGSFRIISGAGADTLFGSQNGDFIYGGRGADQLDGSGGSDLYVYRSVAESTAAERDMIVLDNGDKIDLSFIDAQPGSPGHQPFNYIGDRAFTNNAGELRAIQSGSLWVVEADIDGNGVADLVIDVLASTPMTVDSFVGAAVFM